MKKFIYFQRTYRYIICIFKAKIKDKNFFLIPKFFAAPLKSLVTPQSAAAHRLPNTDIDHIVQVLQISWACVKWYLWCLIRTHVVFDPFWTVLSLWTVLTVAVEKLGSTDYYNLKQHLMYFMYVLHSSLCAYFMYLLAMQIICIRIL